MVFHVLGLMSGTSLDGLDLCYTCFEKNKKGIWKFKIKNTETVPYPKIWEEKLRNSIQMSAEQLCELNVTYGFYLGKLVKNFIKKNSVKKLDLIASHGHTVFHQPKKKFTLQIGDGRAIKAINKIPVIYDFRLQDVLLGGNGAPLVPIGDELLFSEYDACLNLGGFSNISLTFKKKRIAFDICPVNIVLNHYAEKFDKKFDKNGNLAKSGNTDKKILKKLNDLRYYSQNPPKSLGLEWVQKEIFPLLNKLQPEAALATFTEHAAQKIAESFLNYNIKNILITGGGVYNDFLISLIRKKCATSIIIPEKEIIEYKEALVFAFMGMLRYNNEINVLCSATGSTHDHCTGLMV